MFKLPLSPINTFRSSEKVAHLGRRGKSLSGTPLHALPIGPDDRFVEMHIPGLLDPSSISITLKSIGANKYVFVSGEHLDEKCYHDDMWSIEHHRIASFCEEYVVPANAISPVPKATLTVAKDNCGNVSEGILRLEWQVTETNVPIEIKDCSPDDPQ